MRKLILLMNCPDQKGIIASVTNFFHTRDGNIVYIDQYVDRIQNAFFMRIEVEAVLDQDDYEEINSNFQNELGVKFYVKYDFYLADILPKMGVYVSKYDHCLYDILAQQSSGKLRCEIPFIISNHNDLEHIANQFNIPFYHIPVSRETKEEAEEKQLVLLKKYGVNFIVLARYMQIVSKKVIDVFPSKIINIHHSFLPAFPGAKPNHSAFERGVKIIGATSHYVTEDLDAGPIIEQDVAHITHKDTIKDLIRKGKDLEKLVLSRAIRAHLQRQV